MAGVYMAGLYKEGQYKAHCIPGTVYQSGTHGNTRDPPSGLGARQTPRASEGDPSPRRRLRAVSGDGGRQGRGGTK